MSERTPQDVLREPITFNTARKMGEFGMFRKRARTLISLFTVPAGTPFQTPEGLRAEDEECRIAFDVQGGVYPIRESVFQQSYALDKAITEAPDSAPGWDSGTMRALLSDGTTEAPDNPAAHPSVTMLDYGESRETLTTSEVRERELREAAAADPWSFNQGTLRERLEWCRIQHELGADWLDAVAAMPPESRPVNPQKPAEWHRACAKWYAEMVAQLDAAVPATLSEKPGLDELVAALSDVGYIVWGPGKGFPYPQDRAGLDGVVWTAPEKVRALIDRSSSTDSEGR